MGSSWRTLNTLPDSKPVTGLPGIRKPPVTGHPVTWVLPPQDLSPQDQLSLQSLPEPEELSIGFSCLGTPPMAGPVSNYPRLETVLLPSPFLSSRDPETLGPSSSRDFFLGRA